MLLSPITIYAQIEVYNGCSHENNFISITLKSHIRLRSVYTSDKVTFEYVSGKSVFDTYLLLQTLHNPAIYLRLTSEEFTSSVPFAKKIQNSPII